MTTENNLIIMYKNFNTEEKQRFLKQALKLNTESYNESKTFLKDFDNNELMIKYYNIQTKLFYNKVLLFNSIIKNNKENIIKNFKDSNIHLLDYMEIVEDISSSTTSDDCFIEDGGEPIKIGEYYRQTCNIFKEEYDFFNYIIENDLK
jgi:hypothetical protein